jgi:hypothetical protein
MKNCRSPRALTLLQTLAAVALALSACSHSQQPAASASSPAISADFANRSICLAYRGDPKPDSPTLIRAQGDYGTFASPALEDAVRAFLAAHQPNYVDTNNPGVFEAYSAAVGRMVSTCSALVGS